VSLPSFHAVYEPCIGFGTQILDQPGQLHASRVVAPFGLVEHVPRLAVPPKEPAHRGLADPEELGGLLIGPGLPGPVGLDDATPEIERQVSHVSVRSLIGPAGQVLDRLNVEAV